MISSSLLVTAVALGACLTIQTSRAALVPGDDHRINNTSQIQWGPCDPSVVNSTGLPVPISCGFLEVPLDYNNHSVGNARLALAKVNATADRVGTLFFNPGGPGVPGIETLASFASQALLISGGAYDIVSWDPRGVGSLTSPGEIFCFDNTEEHEAFFRGTIELGGIELTGNFTDPADIQALLAQAPIMQQKYEELGKRCLQGPNGKFLKYVGTAATARDLAAIADAIEGPGSLVNYLGISYGTILGSWFINMFPERVGRVVLDAVLDPVFFATQELSLKWSHQLIYADEIYQAFVTGCALAGPDGCAIASAGQSPADVNDSIQALLKAAHDATLANSSVPITSGQIRWQLYNVAMYSPGNWSNIANEVYPVIKQIVEQESQTTAQRNAARSNVMSRTLGKRQNNDNVQYATTAIMCGDSVDSKHTTMEDVFNAIIASSHNVSTMFGAVWPSPMYACALWPVRAVERYQGPFNKKLANKILINGNTFDPITPFPGAKLLADLLGDDAALMRTNAFGHALIAEQSTCTIGIIRAYMANGTLPEGNDTVCEVDADVELFQGVNTAAILASMFNTTSQRVLPEGNDTVRGAVELFKGINGAAR